MNDVNSIAHGSTPRAVQITIPIRALLVVVGVLLGVWALISISHALLLVFTGVFLAFVFEYPLRLLMSKTRLGRGMGATVLVLGSVVVATLLAFLLAVPLLRSVRDFLKDLPQTVSDLRASDELDWLGDTGAAEDVQDGAQSLADTIPLDLSALIGIAGDVFGFALAIFTVVFVALFVLIDMPKIKSAVTSVLPPAEAGRTLDVWERITTTISRWAIGAATIAVIAGTVQGGTAWLLGSSYALALGLIAGFLDLIPNLGATIAGFILVPVVWAEEGLTDALIMLAVVLVYQQIENNLLTPTIQRKATHIWASLVIVSVTVFGALLGVLGALVAVPLTGSIQIVVQELTAERRRRLAAVSAGVEQVPAAETGASGSPPPTDA
ncbi:MAG TPA: AI-2E family transporter [Gaiellaceae bacterium]|nr:AI-2E family transporter [Gaiellaceae bacterium]